MRGIVLLLGAVVVSTAAQAGTPTLTFADGRVGEYSSNIKGPSNIYAFDNGTRSTIQDEVYWRETNGSTLRGIGLRLDQSITDG